MDVAGVLLGTSVFRDLTRADVLELVPETNRRVYARGQSVWVEGDVAEELYVVAEGQLKTFRVNADGTELILQIATRGQLMGEVGTFHPGGVRMTSVTAMIPTTCLTIHREVLLAFFARHPLAMRRMFEALSAVGWHAGQALTEVAFADIRRRVARTLLDLADQQGEVTESGVRIPVKMSQGTLASMIAASREKVNRALALLLARGDISHEDGFFFVHRREALEAIATE